MRKSLIWSLIFAVTTTCTLPPKGWALLAPADIPSTARIAAQTTTREADVRSVQTALESKVVKQRLRELGLTDAEINERLSRLSDRQIHQLATQIHALNAGGDAGAVVGILLLVFLVLGIIYFAKRV